MPTTVANTVVADFKVERITKNTVRFAEVVNDDETPAVGTLYVRQEALVAAGVNVEDENLTVTATFTVA